MAGYFATAVHALLLISRGTAPTSHRANVRQALKAVRYGLAVSITDATERARIAAAMAANSPVQIPAVAAAEPNVAPVLPSEDPYASGSGRLAGERPSAEGLTLTQP